MKVAASHLLTLRPWTRHSLVLWVLGIVYILIGLSYVLTPLTSTREQSLVIALHLLSSQAWGAVWVAVGVCALLSSRWPRDSEKWGYTALSFLSALWATFYVWGVVYGAPLSTISGALVWGGVAFLWWAVSGLRDPLPPLKDD